MSERPQRKVRVGMVVSDKMASTVVVSVERVARHPLYGKIYKTHSKLHAHDSSGEVKLGDRVRVVETRPLSKTKRWRVEKVLEKAR